MPPSFSSFSSFSSSSISSSNSSDSNAKRKSVRENSNSPIRSVAKKAETDNSFIIEPESLQQVKIDGYRQSLKENGFAEIEIPKNLQTQIDAVNEILTKNQSYHSLDNNLNFGEPMLYTRYLKKKASLASIDKETIQSMTKNYELFSQKILAEIFPDKNILDYKKSELNIRCSDDGIYKFHRDIEHVGTLIYPMLDNKGTSYIPYSAKNKYPDNNKMFTISRYNITDDTDVKYADPNKIFLLLCENASKKLGKDYDDKSLIHAVPKSDNPDEPRIFMFGRFGVEDKKPTPPE